MFGVLGTLAVFFTLRRLFGPAPALLAGILLGLNVVQVWFARYPVSETMSQFLLFTAMFLVALWEERRSGAFGALAGVVLGLSLLVRIDSALVVVPLLLYVLIRRVRGDLPWRAALPLLAGFSVLALHAGLHAAFWARKYVVDIATRRYWSQPAAVWVLGTLVVMAATFGLHRYGPEARRFAGPPRPAGPRPRSRRRSCCWPPTPTGCAPRSRPGPAPTATTRRGPSPIPVSCSASASGGWPRTTRNRWCGWAGS